MCSLSLLSLPSLKGRQNRSFLPSSLCTHFPKALEHWLICSLKSTAGTFPEMAGKSFHVSQLPIPNPFSVNTKASIVLEAWVLMCCRNPTSRKTHPQVPESYREFSFLQQAPGLGLWSEEQHRRWLAPSPFMAWLSLVRGRTLMWGILGLLVVGKWGELAISVVDAWSCAHHRTCSTGLSPDTAHLWPKSVMLRGCDFIELHLSSSFCLLLSHSINFLREGSEASSVFKNNQALSLRHDQIASCTVYKSHSCRLNWHQKYLGWRDSLLNMYRSFLLVIIP